MKRTIGIVIVSVAAVLGIGLWANAQAETVRACVDHQGRLSVPTETGKCAEEDASVFLDLGPDDPSGGFSGFERVLGPVVSVPAGGDLPPFQTSLSCPEGKTAIWGGYEQLTELGVHFDTLMERIDGPTYTLSQHRLGSSLDIQLHVICAVVE